ncbi:MAG: hypothetical protein J3K34DRAFT_455214 [Monoraphidium minutum]|nr:MAG: hypothetical protein J3K34DRAFT_455214 [Monoraphidium minutum]
MNTAGLLPARVAVRQPCPAARRAPVALNSSRIRRVRVSAVLSPQRPAQQGDDESKAEQAALVRARRALEAVFLGPSLSEPGQCTPVDAAPIEAGCVYHFAYGCGMHYQSLLRRGVRPLARDAAFIPDPAVRMRFRHKGGYATLETLPAAAGAAPQKPPPRADAQGSPPRPRYPPFVPHVHGVLYKLRDEDMAAIARKEAGYVLREIEVQTYDGRVVRAAAFVSGPLAALPAEVAPPEKYMRALRDGAGDNYLDPLHQAWLSSVETVSSAGLGPEYYNTPSRAISYGFMAVAALLVVGFFAA